MKTNKEGQNSYETISSQDHSVILGLFPPLKGGTHGSNCAEMSNTSRSDLGSAFNMFLFYFMVKYSWKKPPVSSQLQNPFSEFILLFSNISYLLDLYIYSLTVINR